MPIIVGDKNRFGIEYEIQSIGNYPNSGDKFVLGNIRLWIQGKYLGAFQDENIISIYSFYFQDLNVVIIDDGHAFLNLPPDDVLRLINSKAEPDYYNYVFSPGEAFDDFNIVTYLYNNKLVFIWQLVENPFYQHLAYPREVQATEVYFDEYKKIVLEFDKRIQALTRDQ